MSHIFFWKYSTPHRKFKQPLNFAHPCRLTWNTKFSLKFGLRSAKLSLLGEHRRWLRSSGRRHTLKREERGDSFTSSSSPFLSQSPSLAVAESLLDVCLVRDAAILRRPRQVLDLLDVRAQGLGGVVEGEAEVNSPEVVRRERLPSAKEERNGETFNRR